MVPAHGQFDTATQTVSATPSRFRVRYAGPLEFEDMVARYNGRRKDPDRLIWERFHAHLGAQDLPHAQVTTLVQEGVLQVPHDCTIMFIDEYVSLCKCSEGYSHWGTVHVGEKLVKRGRAKGHVAGMLLDLGYRDLDDPNMAAMISDICHGDHYMITDGQISMVVPRGNNRCLSVSKAHLAPLRTNPWEARQAAATAARDAAPSESQETQPRRHPLLTARRRPA